MDEFDALETALAALRKIAAYGDLEIASSNPLDVNASKLAFDECATIAREALAEIEDGE